MHKHRAYEIPEEISQRAGIEYGFLGRYIEERLDEYCKEGWEFVGIYTMSIKPPPGGCMVGLFNGSRVRDAQVMLFRKGSQD